MQRTLTCHLSHVWCECIYLTKLLCTFEERGHFGRGLCLDVNQLNHDDITKLIAVVRDRAIKNIGRVLYRVHQLYPWTIAEGRISYAREIASRDTALLCGRWIVRHDCKTDDTIKPAWVERENVPAKLWAWIISRKNQRRDKLSPANYAPI